MKTKLAALLTAILMAACNQAERPITGQVFIQTRGGVNERIGGVTVYLVPAEVVQRRVEAEEAAARAEREQAAREVREWAAKREEQANQSTKLQRELSELSAESRKLLGRLEDNAAAMQALPAKQRDAVAEANRAGYKKLGEMDARIKELWAAVPEAHLESKRLAAVVLPGPSGVRGPVERLAQLKWPEAVAKSVTDADGRFTLPASPNAKGCLVVLGANRFPPGRERPEFLFWREPVPVAGEALVLSGVNARSEGDAARALAGN